VDNMFENVFCDEGQFDTLSNTSSGSLCAYYMGLDGDFVA